MNETGDGLSDEPAPTRPSTESTREPAREHTPPRDAFPRWLRLALLLCVVLRIAYHVIYVRDDPFALVTFSDGQLYEEAAHDILSASPWGTEPFYLQGLYAYLLSLGLSIHGSVLDGLSLQIIVASVALWLFARAARTSFGNLAGGCSTLVLLIYPSIAFYENKYLSVSLGITCNILVLLAFSRLLRRCDLLGLGLLGFCSGLSILGRANMLLALPFSLLGVVLLARAQGKKLLPLMAAGCVGLVLSLGPMALRNQRVVGHPDIFPSHGGGIPFYIGNNPAANGLWNNAGGLLSGQVVLERQELAAKLGIDAKGRALDEALGSELYRRGFAFIAEHPGQWLVLEVKKLWYTLGNHVFVRDYDVFGEHELLGSPLPFGVPFGVLLALGMLGMALLLDTRSLHPELGADADGQALERADRARNLALAWLLGGQLIAVLVANLLWFSSSQNRVPLAIPLAFAAGPALVALGQRFGVTRLGAARWPAPTTLALLLAAVLGVQAFWPRASTYRPSSVHYYNLASIEEILHEWPQALEHYRLACERNPRQPMFLLRYARLAGLMQRPADARRALTQLLALPALPPRLRTAAERDLERLDLLGS